MGSTQNRETNFAVQTKTTWVSQRKRDQSEEWGWERGISSSSLGDRKILRIQNL